MIDNQKIAIVLSGGGMRCSYSAGVLYALIKEYNFTDPDIMIATSGSAGSVFYYLAGQYDAIKEIWLKRLSTHRFISFLRLGQIMNVNYLIDEVFKKQVPLDVRSLENTKTDFYIPVTNASTNKLRYITNKEHVDPFEVLRAAKAIPVFFGRKVTIEQEEYIDGAMSVTFEETIQKARDLGANLIIAIDTRSKGNRQQLINTFKKTDTIVITNMNIPAGLLTRSEEKLESSFERGYEDAVRNEKLREVLGQIANL